MRIFEFKSKSSERVHRTTLNDAGGITCTCNGFRSPNKCWHFREVSKIADKQETGDLFAPAQPESAAGFVDPMCASALPEGDSITDYPPSSWIMEQKFDGHRIIITVDAERNVYAWSRAGNARELPSHLKAAIKRLAACTIDTEMYIPGMTSTDVTRTDLQHLLQIAAFDILRIQTPDGVWHSVMSKPAPERRAALELAMSRVNDPMVKVAEQYTPSPAGLQEMWAKGFEGAIVKRKTTVYIAGKRTKDWIKFKKGGSAECVIAGFEKGKLGPHSKIKGTTAEGIEVSVKSLNDAWRARFAVSADKYLGLTLVFSYIERTRDGKYKSAMADHILAEGPLRLS